MGMIYILYTYDSVAAHPSNRVVKFADDTTVIGLISEREGETDYRDEVERLTEWCRANNLLINTRKTKELVVDFRRQKSNVQPLLIDGVCVERVTTFRFLGIELQEDLSWSVNIRGLVKKAQQRLYFLRILRKNHLPQKLLLAFYHCAIESVLTYGLCVWYGSCTTQDRMGLCRVVKAAESIVGCPLSTLEQIYATRCHRKALDIVKDPSHPGHCLFELLPSGWRYRTMKTRTSRLKNSFFSRAISALNGKPGL
uniref:Alkylated DNA repair protein AlkB homologue 8 N-terminal domain-containing protein n=1 Tax=Podarcis muralis TaxID=64176 RepID=A0A670HWE1_PODMU